MSARGRSAAARVDETPTLEGGKTALRVRHRGQIVDAVPREGQAPAVFVHALEECDQVAAEPRALLAMVAHPYAEIVPAWRTPAWAVDGLDVQLGSRAR